MTVDVIRVWTFGAEDELVFTTAIHAFFVVLDLFVRIRSRVLLLS